MPAFAATAPGKIILFGEHAVVYGRPAIAVPVTQVQAKAAITPAPTAPQGQVQVIAKDIGLNADLASLPADHLFVIAVQSVLELTGISRLPALRLQITSTIPIAAGLGSGAAVSAAIARALSAFLGRKLTDEQVSEVAYRVDQHYHGTPSGVDNTVITYAQPVYFVKGQPFERLTVRSPFTVVIGNTGISSPTKTAVGDVRHLWEQDRSAFESRFDAIGEIACAAREAIESGHPAALGPLMARNHALLQEITVSSPELDRLVNAAIDSGALGAKLCGGGRGGNMIALVDPAHAPVVAEALQTAGAVNTITTTVG